MRKLMAIWALLGLAVWGLSTLGGCASHTQLGGRQVGATANWVPATNSEAVSYGSP